jgi:hypothetical protein
MPNWFYFTVNVSGEEKDVEQFVENVKGSAKYETEGREFDFNHFIPQPDNIFRGNLGDKEEKMCEEQGIPNWYRWNNQNWGTKWNGVCDDFEIGSINGSSHFAEYNLRTAWADPRPVLHKMIDMYPNLDFIVSGEEESSAYGIYMSTRENVFLEEEPILVDEGDREVYFDNEKEYLWMYKDNDELVPDQDDFYPMSKFSWD